MYIVSDKGDCARGNITIGNDMIEKMESYKFPRCHINDVWDFSGENDAELN